MIILGIDPGLNKTGWGVINVKKNIPTYIADGFISNKIENEEGDKLLTLFNEIEKIINFYKPNLIGIERTFVGAGHNSSLQLGMARGVCILCCSKAGINFVQLAPKFIKKSVTGSGSALKYQIKEMIINMLGVIPKNLDSADALAVAISANNNTTYPNTVFNSTNNNLNKAIKLALSREKNKIS